MKLGRKAIVLALSVFMLISTIPAAVFADDTEVGYPAQTLEATASDGAVITVDAPEGAFPEGSYAEAAPVSEEEVLPLVDGAAEAAAYDITVYDEDGNEVQPKKEVKVSIANTGLDEADAVYHIDDSMTKASLVTDNVDKAGDAFYVSHFSIYSVYLSGNGNGQLEYQVHDMTLHVGDTVTLTSDKVYSSTGDPGNSWRIWASEGSTQPSEGLSTQIGSFKNNGIVGQTDRFYSYIEITALKAGVYNVENTSDKVNGAVTSIRITVKDQFTVSYNMNGHGAQVASQTVDSGDKATKPADPTAEGFVFKGWVTASGTLFDFNTPITENTQLNARWAESHKVTFKDSDGTVLSEADYEAGTYASAIVVPQVPPRSEDDDHAYAFNGWDKPITAVTADAVYTATYTIKTKYTVTFYNYDGSKSLVSGKYIEGTELSSIAPSDPRREETGQYSYTFAGWAKAKDQTSGTLTANLPAVSANVTYYAAYTATEREYKVRFLNDDGTVLKVQMLKFHETPSFEGTPTKKPDEQYSYRFNAWYDGYSRYTGFYPITGSADYTALYYKEPRKYTVKFVDEDGKVLLADKEYEYGTKPDKIETPKEPTKAAAANEDCSYVFDGWEPEVADVKKDATYKAKYKKLAFYCLNVTMIQAGEEATPASVVKEASGKTGVQIYSTAWEDTREKLEEEKAYWARQSSNHPTPFRGEFKEGETYYSVAIVEFPKDEEPDISRVSLHETENIKLAGDPVVNKNDTENQVIVPFSVYIPISKITVTVDFGSGHEAYAKAVASAGNDKNIKMKASGRKVSFEARGGEDLWSDDLAPLHDALHKLNRRIDNNEKLHDYEVNLKEMSSYSGEDAFEADYDALNDMHPRDDVTVYAQWQKRAEVSLKITKPACGTKVTYEEVGSQQTSRPEITVTSGNASIAKVDDPDYKFDPNYWVRSGGDYLEPYEGTIKGGRNYRASTMLEPDFGYYVDPAKVTVENGEFAGTGRMSEIYIDVEVEHAFGDWLETTPAADGVAGEKTRTCPGCGEKDTMVIPPVGHAHDKPLTKVEKKDAKCTESGHKEYYKCNGCGALFEDAAGTVQISESSIRIPAKGHRSGEPEKGEVTQPTCCLPGGYNLITKCSTCKAVLKVERILIDIDPDAHDWGEWVVTKQVTETEDGEMVRTCKIDPSHTETKVIHHGDIEDAEIVLSGTTFKYNGKVQKPAIKSIRGMTLTEGTDYTAEWSNASSKNVGKYTVTITGTGEFKGVTKATYKIVPKGTSLKKPKKAKKALTVKWKKQPAKMAKSRITGYQIQLATNKKFTKNKKTVTVKGYKKTAKKVKKLKGGKKYYVRIRTYKTVNGTKIYSKWSKAKSARTKR